MGRRGGSIERETSTQDTQGDTEHSPSSTNLLDRERAGSRRKETFILFIYLRSLIYLCYAFLIFILVWMMGRFCQKFSFPPTIFKARHTEKHVYRLGMVQSPSLYCSEFGRHLMLNYRFEMGVEEVAAGVQMCLRYAHPHQTSSNAYESTLALFQSEDLCRFRENLVLRSAPRDATAWGGNWEALVSTGPTANAITQDGLAHWYWRWTGNETASGDLWERTEYGLMLKEALEWWTLGHTAIPISPSLHRAMTMKSSILRHIRETDYLINSRRRLRQGELFAFPNDIYPMKPDTTAPGGKFLMRFRSANISRMGFPDPKGVRRDFKICKYSALSESTADIIQIFMTTYKDHFDYVGEHNFSPTYLKGLIKLEEAIMAKWMSWDYLDPERYRKVTIKDLGIKDEDDPYMTEHTSKRDENMKKGAARDDTSKFKGEGYILAERGSETTNSWKGLSGEGQGYGMWFNCTDLFDETILPYDLEQYPILGTIPVQRWYDSGTALISVVSHTGDSAIAISSLYEEFGSGTFYRNMAMNSFQKLLRQEFTRQSVKEQFQPFILPFQPLLLSVDRGDALFPYNMDIYGTVTSGRNLLPLVEPIEVLLSAAFGPWAVTDIDRALAEGRMHMSWVTDEEYAMLARKDLLHDHVSGLTRGAVKLQYSAVIPATIREMVIKRVMDDGPNVVREKYGFDKDDRTIGFSWSSATGIVGSNRAGTPDHIPQATGY